MNIYGRLLNQLGSKISAHSMTVISKGKVFNTGGSIMEGLLSFSSDGFENGAGSKVLGSLGIVSQGSIYNFGEIVIVENPLQMVTDFSIGNYGSMSSSEKITLTAHGNVKNIGSMSSKSIELHIGSSDVIETNILPSTMQNGSITARDLIFECFTATPISSAVSLSDLVQNAGIEAEEVKFLFPNATLENQSDNILKFRSTIFAKEFRNLALLRSLKSLAILTSQQLINAASDSALNPSATEEKVKTFRLLDDYDIGKQEELRRHLTTDKIDCLQDKAENNARIIVEGDLSDII